MLSMEVMTSLMVSSEDVDLAIAVIDTAEPVTALDHERECGRRRNERACGRRCGATVGTRAPACARAVSGGARYRETVREAAKAPFREPASKVPLAAVVASLALMPPPPLAGVGVQALARHTAVTIKAAVDAAAAKSAAAAAAAEAAKSSLTAAAEPASGKPVAAPQHAQGEAWSDGFGHLLHSCFGRAESELAVAVAPAGAPVVAAVVAPAPTSGTVVAAPGALGVDPYAAAAPAAAAAAATTSSSEPVSGVL